MTFLYKINYYPLSPFHCLYRKDNIVRVVTTTSFRLHVFMTATGLRFAILSSLETPRLDQTLSYLYQLYVEYVAKNPLYTVGDTINCDRFHKEVKRHLTGEVYNFNSMNRPMAM